jgi:hypothetical protein
LAVGKCGRGSEPNARSRHFRRDMQKVEDYRDHADECRAMARRSRTPEERAMLLNMAKTWDDLATHRVEQIARKKRIAALPGGDDQAAPASIPIDRLNASNDK